MFDFDFNLQLFGEGGAGAAGGDGGAAAGAEGATGVTAPDAGERRQKRVNPLANVKYGRQPEVPAREVAAPTEEAANTGMEEQTEKRKSFDELIKGEYKADYDAKVQGIVQERVRGIKDAEERMNNLAPALEALGKFYNVDPTDTAKLIEAVNNDDRLHEAEAAARGMDVETYKQVRGLEREVERMKANEQRTLREQQMRAHYENLVRQTEAAKKLYPDIDLRAEMNNPEFARLTAPGVGIDVRTAYEVVHRDELRGAEMQYGAQKAAERVANSVRANGMRPAENGLNGQQGASVVKTDPRSLTRADRAEIRERVRRGEKIVF